ncbi:hypothetical protein [Lederbergia citri]|uniref:Uncharacterized protein n=1 Tax=Lederbergia citri TaxID=2833580 RepID=A0A942YGG4_9BACI|nr:hypothetical protein [Lederbergia citri]MBS4195497.1 hypothetical protein [Lederbergia citri]
MGESHTNLDYIFSTEFIKKFNLRSIRFNKNNNFLIFYTDTVNSYIDKEISSKKIFNKAKFFLETPKIKFKIVCPKTSIIIQDSFYSYYLNILLIENIIDLVDKNNIVKLTRDLQASLEKKIREMFILWGNLSRKNKMEINKILRNRIIKFEIFNREFETVYRYEQYVELTNKLYNLARQKNEVKNILSLDSSTKIAIYGAGNIGRILFKILKQNNIKTKIFIDQYSSNDSFQGTPIISAEALMHNRIYDIIIVTPIYDFDIIYNKLKDYTDKPIISLNELL